MLARLVQYVIRKLKQKILPPPLQVIYKSEKGFSIEKKHDDDSCFDLKSTEDIILESGKCGVIPTGIFIQLEKNTEAQIRSRSGLALNHQIFVLNSPGTIDSGYTGEIKIILFNLGKNSFPIKKGDRVAQIHFTRIDKVTTKLVEFIKQETDRKDKGFGSTGV